MLVLAFFDDYILLIIFAVLHGLAWGIRGPQMVAIRADYFGAKSFGKIMGDFFIGGHAWYDGRTIDLRVSRGPIWNLP